MIAPPTIVVPGGDFFLGALLQDKFANATELPRRRVAVASFALGKYPVTNREWTGFAPGHQGEPDLPVTNVSWREAQAYLAWLSIATDESWRIPTEIEWEYACRAGSETLFPQGDDLSPTDANFLYDESIERVGPGRLTPVGTYPPNAWGFHDLLGNVNEWTASPWTQSHEPDATIVPGSLTIRGGSWDGLPRLLRPSWRDGVEAGARCDHLGFRVARGG
jgi:formylglycine-generating enzyme required for sulfatase activity